MSVPERDLDASSFAELGVEDDLVELLSQRGITEPFPIQTATIRDALAGRDVLGRAPTGSGKTLAFGIPMITNVERARPHRPTGLILSPTRELAEQIRRELEPLGRARGKRLTAIYGGVGFGPQLQALRRGVELIVACPGRLQDLVDQEQVSLESVSTVVIDEADRMADMGFLPAVRQLVDLTMDDRQTLLFSATLGREVQALTDRYQTDPVRHEVGDADPDLSLVSHRFIHTDRHGKVQLAAQIIDDAGPTIVFCRTRYGVDRVARQLKNEGVKTSLIHGKRTQNQRDNALAAFTKGRVDALVATDVAARGIHVDGVACVLHFDPPEDQAAYVHRSGRTARAGAGGAVVSFVNSDQVKATRQLQRSLRLPQEVEDAPAVAEREPRATERTEQQERSGQQKRSGQQRRGGQQKRSGQQKQSAGHGRPKNKSGSKRRSASTSRPSSSGTRSSAGGRPQGRSQRPPGGRKGGPRPGSKRRR
ncbi:MAG: DEAD/DEAH box helicase [Acidimicrobiia bacterium]|nr:DEAD/DEAH box helicase [Acidimicrobiia bacterium]